MRNTGAGAIGLQPNTGPLYCITSDVDWASEFCLQDFLAVMGRFGIRPTMFATHDSPVLRKGLSGRVLDVGIHPNFDPGTSHAADHDDIAAVLSHISALYPEAQTFRSHRFHDSTPIALAMVRRGYQYDSNVCCYLQPGLVPLRHAFGSLRFPVFWEDDVHWYNNPADWNSAKYLPHFFTPGLKIINVHPFMIASNCTSAEHYASIKTHIQSLTSDTVDQVRHKGQGCRTFLLDVLEEVHKRGGRFHTLAELYALFREEEALRTIIEHPPAHRPALGAN